MQELILTARVSVVLKPYIIFKALHSTVCSMHSRRICMLKDRRRLIEERDNYILCPILGTVLDAFPAASKLRHDKVKFLDIKLKRQSWVCI